MAGVSAAAVRVAASMATEAAAAAAVTTLAAAVAVILYSAVQVPRPMRMPCRMEAVEAVEAVSRCMAAVAYRTASMASSRAVAATEDR